MTILQINRTVPFNPAALLGENWSSVEVDQDERSIVLTEVDLTKVRLETMLKDGESSVSGEEKLKRLISASFIRLDAKVFQTFWENKHFIPEEWKQPIRGKMMGVYFYGTILRDGEDGFVLYLYWNYDRDKWDWQVESLDDLQDDAGLSAVLAV